MSKQPATKSGLGPPNTSACAREGQPATRSGLGSPGAYAQPCAREGQPAGPVEFLVIGHVTNDIVGPDLRLGGTASYAAVVAARLGVRTAILTSAADDLRLPAELTGVAFHNLSAAHTTVMEHQFIGRRREQYVRSRAEVITASLLPQQLWSAPVVLVGPVTGEVENDVLDSFPNALRGATVQGWLRQVAADGYVESMDAAAWDYAPVLSKLQAAFLSEDDVGGDIESVRTVLDAWTRTVSILVVTRGEAGALISVDGNWYSIGVMPSSEVDATGAGDAFAAGFLIRYHETADASEAARFATAVAAFVVEATGIAGAPTREQVDNRLAANPDVRLRELGPRLPR
jgi:sugar/nucleoside kinase (ribokinase family)